MRAYVPGVVGVGVVKQLEQCPFLFQLKHLTLVMSRSDFIKGFLPTVVNVMPSESLKIHRLSSDCWQLTIRL
jgi:hypothetical protein